jgi:hypothetical protein
MSYSAQELYELLPSVYRQRDAQQGGVLRALIEVLAREANIVDADIEQLYENWFIETCQEWVAPYIGDLLGTAPLFAIAGSATFSAKGYVANTIAYRRRAGTLAVLEQVAYDVSNWPTHASEQFQLLGWTQNLNHLRFIKGGPLQLHPQNNLELLDGPFEDAAHTVEVRCARSGRGRYNIPDIGIWMYRLSSYDLPHVSARTGPAAGQYFAHPAGRDVHFFAPGGEQTIDRLARESDMPAPARRLALHLELEAMRQAAVDQVAFAPVWFDPENEIFELFWTKVGDPPGTVPQKVPAAEILIANLTNWPVTPPLNSKSYQPADHTAPQQPLPITALVDPALGRVAFSSGLQPDRVELRYNYGFSGDLGGGPYSRAGSPALAVAGEAAWTKTVHDSTELAAALNEWNGLAQKSTGSILFLSSLTQNPDGSGIFRIDVPDGGSFTLVAQDGERPCLAAPIEVHSLADASSQTPGSLQIDGLLIAGGLTVKAGNLGALSISHAILIPGASGIVAVEAGHSRLVLTLTRAICGGVQLDGAAASVSLTDSVVAGPSGGDGIVCTDTAANIDSSTVRGAVRAMELSASNSIFLDRVSVERRQTGCVRFSWVPPRSKTPRRFRCQPDLASAGITDPLALARIAAALAPQFTSTSYGDAAFFQLSSACAQEIRTGAESELEMGAWFFLRQPQRETNVRTAVAGYLRVGLEAGFYFVT